MIVPVEKGKIEIKVIEEWGKMKGATRPLLYSYLR